MSDISFKGKHYPKEVILQAVRWYVSYALSYRNIEELLHERGYNIDHATINRWVLEYSPQLLEAFNRKKRKVGKRWRLDETYIKIKGEWKYYYRAVDKNGNTIDFLLTAKRDAQAAKRYLKKAIKLSGKPSLIDMYKSGANKAALNQYNSENNKRVKIRQNKYLNNLIEQDHRFIKKIVRASQGFKNFFCGQRTLKGIELMHMLRKGQFKTSKKDKRSVVELFYSLAG